MLIFNFQPINTHIHIMFGVSMRLQLICNRDENPIPFAWEIVNTLDSIWHMHTAHCTYTHTILGSRIQYARCLLKNEEKTNHSITQLNWLVLVYYGKWANGQMSKHEKWEMKLIHLKSFHFIFHIQDSMHKFYITHNIHSYNFTILSKDSDCDFRK